MNSFELSKNGNRLVITLCVLISFFIFYCFYSDKLIYLIAIPIFFYSSFAVIKPDFIWFSIAFLTPLSINPWDVDLGKLSLALPTEPLFVLLIVLFASQLVLKKEMSKEIFSHPFSILIYLYLGWMLVTSVTSVDKLVSIKFFISKFWFIVPGYFLTYYYFIDRKKIITFYTLIIVAMVIVCSYNIIHLMTYGFEDKPSQWTMQPFFKSHAVLGAVIAMCIPINLGLVSYNRGKAVKQLGFILIFTILTICLIVTYSRAAWLSVIPSMLMYIALRLRFPFKALMTFAIVGILALLFNIESVIRNLETNKIASSDDLVENVESISNISSDASNLERINRWACAIDMWKAKPIFGFGPGTYMTEYAPFQLSGNYTEISTNSGDVGNSHSEYLGPLSEQGLLGGLLFIAIMFFCIYYSFNTYYNATEKMDKIIISSVGCGLISYLTHGFLNNFLDMDKAAIPFWTMICVLVVYDIKQRGITQNKLNTQ
ncbi:MAG: O-antigen ligase family protein [Saprospiraceae bacterium]|nr:O-antigen ligase family protein [Saprospiraceae bacterium]